jgi:hypothetical protein
MAFMLLTKPFCRVFVTIGTESGSDGYDVCARHDSGRAYEENPVVARYVCPDRASLRTVLEALGADGVSRFVQEDFQGSTFEYVPGRIDELLTIVERQDGPGLQHVTMIASAVSADGMKTRFYAADLLARRVNVAINESTHN